ncbi:MAG: polymer-forming cytoskeletal protein [Odoribacteraceae bacterium]|jgi:cytoskeletal protein CcmA (bactofilin family)|nr:polymer-forming cytoskeletal protein [Odoribacteraceae bacterium]
MSRDQHKSNTSDRQTVILDETEITGELVITGADLLLLGKVNGNIKCSGRVIINEGAKVSGNILCDILDLNGTVDGAVKSTLLTLREQGVIRGDVETSGLRIRGGKINITTLRLVSN